MELGRDRELVLDANIIKLMKTKKLLLFDTMAGEVVKMVKVFAPSLKDIKFSVERLLAKDILSRDDKEKKLLKYRD